MPFLFSIKTLGCKLNQYESSLIASILKKRGWTSVPFGDNADLVIVNTCTVTNKSDKKCRNYIRQGAKFSKSGKVIVTGCMAESEGNLLLEMPEVFAVIGNKDKENISHIASTIDSYGDDRLFANRNFAEPYYRTRGLLKIQDGCDGECSYCIVPSVRGVPVSRPYNEIISHAENLINTGIPEIILTGITIGKYEFENKKLHDLVSGLSGLNGNFRIRITSIEPMHVTDKLIDLTTHEKVCSHLHVPLQSGSDNILKSMRRPYSYSEYMNVIEKIRKKNADIAIGTDIIIGFPGETEEDFDSSLSVIESALFSYVHQFSFSVRKGTPAGSMKHQIDAKVINERYKKMKEISGGISEIYKRKFIGKSLPSIIEKNKGVSGYTAVSNNYLKMSIEELFAGETLTGKITDVILESVEGNRNVGRIPGK